MQESSARSYISPNECLGVSGQKFDPVVRYRQVFYRTAVRVTERSGEPDRRTEQDRPVVAPGNGAAKEAVMSAVAIPVTGRRGSRPALRSVPTGPAARGYALDATSERDLVGPRPQLRLTQRGRLLRTLVCFGVLCLLVSLAVARLTAPGPLVADHVTTVKPGQTLTDIARAQLPAHPVGEGVQMLRELNQMNSTVVVAGQSLLVPAP